MHNETVSPVGLEPSIGIAGQPVPTRVASIDIFRGLTMLVMIFVNDLASVKGLPWWNYHMEEKNGMTYVDMVFPAFLFILGMSIPIATRQRLKRDGSVARLWGHILLRTISLLVLGLILANAEKGDSRLMGVNPNVWAALALLGAVLFWMVYTRSERYGTLFRVLKSAGLVLIAAMFAIFRRTTHDGHVAWIDTGYWEILGLIGWTYLAASILYVPTRKWRFAPVGWFVLLTILNVATVARWIRWPNHLPSYVWPFGSGALCLIAMAGVVTSQLFLGENFFGENFLGENKARTFQAKARWAFLFASVALAAGWLLTPLGISKIHATPTWCLYSVGSSVILFTALYWICDVKKRTGWARFAHAAGGEHANDLFTSRLLLLCDLGAGAYVFGDSFQPGVGWRYSRHFIYRVHSGSFHSAHSAEDQDAVVKKYSGRFGLSGASASYRKY